jgi:hypothetical protein
MMQPDGFVLNPVRIDSVMPGESCCSHNFPAAVSLATAYDLVERFPRHTNRVADLLQSYCYKNHGVD